MTQALMPLELVGAKRTGKHAGGHPQKYVLDKPGRRLILARYDGTSKVIDELMQHFPGYPRYIIKKWGRELGLARQKEPRWTEHEITYLEHNLYKKRLGDIAKHLRRTETAVRLKAKRLGMNKTQEGYTMRGLCLGLGIDHHKVEKWLANGWIKARRRGSDRTPEQGGDIWYFSDKAIKDFIRHHPEEIDPRRADWLWLVDILVGGDYGGIGALGSEIAS